MRDRDQCPCSGPSAAFLRHFRVSNSLMTYVVSLSFVTEVCEVLEGLSVQQEPCAPLHILNQTVCRGGSGRGGDSKRLLESVSWCTYA